MKSNRLLKVGIKLLEAVGFYSLEMIGCFFTIFAYNYRLFYIKKYGMKRLFIIGICLCLSGMVSAQWHVGCEVGANWSTVKFPSYEMGGKRMTGFNIGAGGDVPLE